VSKRLQVILPEADMLQIQQCARAQQLTVAEWVRRAIVFAQRAGPSGEAARKLMAWRSPAAASGGPGASPVAFPLVLPAAGIRQMLADIERGYRSPTS
jgi:hypothetical protein